MSSVLAAQDAVQGGGLAVLGFRVEGFPSVALLSFVTAYSILDLNSRET